MLTLTRRTLLALPGLCLLPCAAGAAAAVGTTLALQGSAQLRRAGGALPLHPQDMLLEQDGVATAADSFAELELFTATRIHLGPQAEFTIDRFAADLGGRLVVGGAMVFDRPDDLPKLDLQVQTAFGQIGVRGTRFFAGPEGGGFAVFVQHGAVDLLAGGVQTRIAAGEGVDVPAPGAPPSAVKRWGATRIAAALALAGAAP